MPNTHPLCIKCEKPLHQSVCLVENSGFGKFSYPMLSAHYDFTFSGYLCDECTTLLISRGILNKV